MKFAKSTVSRRSVLAASFATGGLVAAKVTPLLAALSVATPQQTAGPFYPRRKPLDEDNDLTMVRGRTGRADGRTIQVMGRVLDRTGRPRRGAIVEIWQCDVNGRYHHVNGGRGVARDDNFQGFGRDVTDDTGAYHFKTIEPPPYRASATWMRPAHIHFAVSGPGFDRLVTQMYFAGDAYLEHDPIFNGIRDEAARASVVASLAAPTAGTESGGDIATFDIVLGQSG